MARIIAAFFTASLVVAATAAPASTQAKRFSVNQVPVQRNATRSLAGQLAKAYKKYGVAVPSNVVAATTDTSSVNATSDERFGTLSR